MFSILQKDLKKLANPGKAKLLISQGDALRDWSLKGVSL